MIDAQQDPLMRLEALVRDLASRMSESGSRFRSTKPRDAQEVSGSLCPGPFFISPVVVHTSAVATPVGWTTFDSSPHLPPGASAAILEAEWAISHPDGGDADAHIRVRLPGAASSLLLGRGRASSSADNVAGSMQGSYPLDARRRFEFTVEAPGFDHGHTIRLVGYWQCGSSAEPPSGKSSPGEPILD